MQRPDHVRADDEVAVRVDRLAGADQGLPPAGLAGDRMGMGEILVAGERVADQHRVRARGVQGAGGLVGDLEGRELDAGIGAQRRVDAERRRPGSSGRAPARARTRAGPSRRSGPAAGPCPVGCPWRVLTTVSREPGPQRGCTASPRPRPTRPTRPARSGGNARGRRASTREAGGSARSGAPVPVLYDRCRTYAIGGRHQGQPESGEAERQGGAGVQAVGADAAAPAPARRALDEHARPARARTRRSPGSKPWKPHRAGRARYAAHHGWGSARGRRRFLRR